MAESEPAKDQRKRSGDHLCSDIRDTCVVGDALRRGLHPIDALSRALDELLYSGVTPWRKPLERGDAVARLAERHCRKHRAEAELVLASISPGAGLPRDPRASASDENPRLT